MSKIVTYIRESYKELTQKVTWPTWAQLQNNALIVMLVTLILAIVILVMDLAFKSIMTAIYKMLY